MTELMDECLEVLNEAYAFKANSLASYVLSAEPYIGEGEEGLLKVISEISQRDLEMQKFLLEEIEGLEGVPRITPPDPFVSELNYLSISYLKTVIQGDLVKQAHFFEESLERFSAVESVKHVFETLVRVAKQQLAALAG